MTPHRTSLNTLGYTETRLDYPSTTSMLSGITAADSDVTVGQLESSKHTTTKTPALNEYDITPNSKSFDTTTDISDRTLKAKISRLVATSTRCKVTNTQDEDFNEVLGEALEAIAMGVYPQLISAGSSGSYYVYNKRNKPIAVFKPKDEEPFAPLNPKWPKYFQRVLCFCCFGRACLIPNNGYLSETAASLVDERLNLYVVPKTRVVKLASPTFNYGRHIFGTPSIKGKEGSFQLFVDDFRSAEDVLAEWNAGKDENALSDENEERFVLLFQKMCTLDYIIRNTDRHLDNWLIKYAPDEPIQIAVIDNGLAFPVKHPECASRFRQFPFAWAELSWAQQPLNREFRNHLLQLLTPAFVNELCEDLKALFRHDKSHNRLLSYSQIRVLRGQLWNLRDALVADESPSQWVNREPCIATRRQQKISSTATSFEECFSRRAADYSHRGWC